MSLSFTIVPAVLCQTVVKATGTCRALTLRRQASYRPSFTQTGAGTSRRITQDQRPQRRGRFMSSVAVLLTTGRFEAKERKE